jgi:hypothetical protein
LTNLSNMSKEQTNPRLLRRAAKIQSEINKLETKGYRLDRAVPIIAEKYFLSNSTVYADYYLDLDKNNIPHPGNTPPSREHI